MGSDEEIGERLERLAQVQRHHQDATVLVASLVKDAIRKAYEAGWTRERIAAAMGVSTTGVTKKMTAPGREGGATR